MKTKKHIKKFFMKLRFTIFRYQIKVEAKKLS